MLKTNVVKGVLGLSAVAALFAAAVVHAQTGSTTGGTAGGTMGTTGAATSTSTGQSTTDKAGTQASQSGQGGTTASGTASSGVKLSGGDRKMLMTMAQSNMAEIEMARMAQSKSQSEQVKNFAQQMIDDHTKGLTDVQQLAQARGVALPSGLDRAHRAKADKLGALSGEAFDRAYMAQAGVEAHKKTHDQLRAAQSRARDPDVKALAARAMPMVGQHLHSAQQLHKNTASGRSGTQGSTGSSPERRQNQQNPQNQQNQQGEQPSQKQGQ